jgi:hypothetical protein
MATNENPTKRLNAYDTLRQRYGLKIPAFFCFAAAITNLATMLNPLLMFFIFQEDHTDAVNESDSISRGALWFFLGISFVLIGDVLKDQRDRIQKQIQALEASLAELKEKPAE